MNTRSLSLVIGTVGFAWAAVAAAAPYASHAPGADLLRDAVQSDERGAHARASGFAANVVNTIHGDGSGNWSPLGPPGGDVADVAASPTASGVVLAGIAPGGSWGGTLYRSTDSGATWAAVPDLAGISVHDIEYAPDGTVFAATQDAVWTSTDDGANWTHIDLGIDQNNDETFDITIDPQNASTIWVGVTAAGGFEPVNLMRSIDGGTTWDDLTPPHDAPMNGMGIAVDPNDSDTVVAVFRGDFGGGEVWVTIDGGDTWENRTDGLNGNPINAVNYDGTRLLVGGGQNFGSQDFGLYTSDDLGVTWSPLYDGTWPLLVVTDIAVDPNDGQTILVSTDGAGINRSGDGGATWDIGIGGTAAVATQSVRFAPTSSLDIYSGANSLGVFKSTDGGDNFAGASSGIFELSLYSIAVNPADAEQLAVAFQGNNNGGVFSSNDGGTTWTQEPVPPTRYSKVGFSPDGVLYAISSGPSTVAPEGLYRREDNDTWTGLGPDQGPLYESDLAALRFSKNDPNLILLGGADFGVAGSEQTVWRSIDAGANWDKVFEGTDGNFVTDIEIAEDGTDQLMVASYDGYNDPQQGGALRSIDGGATWQLALDGLPGFSRLPRLCESPTHPETIFMSSWVDFSHSTIYRTDDAGATWTSTGYSGDLIADIACNPVDEQVLYVAQASGQPVQRSGDGGVTFSPFSTGLSNPGGPRDLAITPVSDFAAELLMAASKGSYLTPIVADDTIFADGFD